VAFEVALSVPFQCGMVVRLCSGQRFMRVWVCLYALFYAVDRFFRHEHDYVSSCRWAGPCSVPIDDLAVDTLYLSYVTYFTFI